jgi:hypothetical protein
MTMRVVQSAVYYWRREETTAALKTALAQSQAVVFRRLNAFSLLSLVGATRCLTRESAHPLAGVYVGTAQGALADTEKVLHQIYHERQLPLPLDFIYTMSNTATFHVAQAFGFTGPNNLLTHNDCAFERCCQLAGVDIAAGSIRHALIGAVDIVPFDLAREGEGWGRSSWVWCEGVSPGVKVPRGLAIKDHADRHALAAYCRSLTGMIGRVTVSLGIGARELTEDITRWGLTPWIDTEEEEPVKRADHNTASRIARFSARGGDGALLHVTPLPHGGYVTTLVGS